MSINYIKQQFEWYKAFYLAKKYEISMNDYKYHHESTFEINKNQLELERSLYDLEKRYQYSLSTRDETSKLFSDCILVYSQTSTLRPCTKLIKTFKSLVSTREI